MLVEIDDNGVGFDICSPASVKVGRLRTHGGFGYIAYRMCQVVLMHCRQSLKHDAGRPFDLLFLKLPLAPRIQHVVEVVGKIFKDHNLPIWDNIDYLSKGAMATKVSVKGVGFGVERLIVTGFFENYALLIIAFAHCQGRQEFQGVSS